MTERCFGEQKRSIFLPWRLVAAVMSLGAAWLFGAAGYTTAGGLSGSAGDARERSQPQLVSPWPHDRPDAVQSSEKSTLYPHPTSTTTTPSSLSSSAQLQVTSCNFHCMHPICEIRSLDRPKIIPANKFHPQFLPWDKLYRA